MGKNREGINVNIDPIELLEYGAKQGAQYQALLSQYHVLQGVYAAQQAGYLVPPNIQAFALGGSAGYSPIGLMPRGVNAAQLLLEADQRELLRSAAPSPALAQVPVCPTAPPPVVAEEISPDIDEGDELEERKIAVVGTAIATTIKFLLGGVVVVLVIAIAAGINPIRLLPWGLGKAAETAPKTLPTASPSASPADVLPSPPSPEGSALPPTGGLSEKIQNYVKSPSVQ